MTIDLQAHRVTKIIICPEFRFESGGQQLVSRDIQIVFADGSKQEIDCYAVAGHDITLEIQNDN